MAYTAITAKAFREKAGSLAKKLATELGLIATELTAIQGLADGKVIVGNGAGAATDVDMSGDVTIVNTGAVTIADDAVTAAKAHVFQSAEVTSNGSTENTAHGLGATPSVYFAIAQEFGTAQNPNISCAADATNIAVTAASTDVKYIVFAWL